MADPANVPGTLDERVVNTLSERDGRFAFNGLRRALGAHPESLSRALRRLERSGTIARVDGGYRLIRGHTESLDPVAGIEPKVVARVALPRGVEAGEIQGALAGRWFSKLHWTGTVDDGEASWLVWSADGVAGHVMLVVKNDAMLVAVEDSIDPSARAALEEAARALLIQALRRVPPSSNGSYATVATFPMSPERRALDN